MYIYIYDWVHVDPQIQSGYCMKKGFDYKF